MRKKLRTYLVLTIFFSCTNCASTQEEQVMYLPSSDSANTATGDAYTADSMHFSKPIPSRPDWKPMEFYFKHCSQVDGKAYYSKTSYDCSGPY